MDLRTARKILGVTENATHNEINRQFKAKRLAAKNHFEKREVMEAYNVLSGSTPADQLPAIFTGRIRQRKQSPPRPEPEPRARPRQEQQRTTIRTTSVVIYQSSVFYRDFQDHMKRAQQAGSAAYARAMPHGAAAFYKGLLDKARNRLRVVFLAIFIAAMIPTYLLVDNFRTWWPFPHSTTFEEHAFLYNSHADIEDWQYRWFPVVEECERYYGVPLYPFTLYTGFIEYHPNHQMTHDRDGIKAPRFRRGEVGGNPPYQSWQDMAVRGDYGWKPNATMNLLAMRGALQGVETKPNNNLTREQTTCELAVGFIRDEYIDVLKYNKDWRILFGFIMFVVALTLGLIYRSRSKKIDRDYDDFIAAIQSG